MGITSVRQEIADRIPVQVELQRARQMIAELKPEIAENLRRIAKEEVDLERLQEELETKQQRADKARSDVVRLKDDLESGKERFVYAKKSYTAEQVKEDLATRFRQLQTQEATVEKLDQVFHARQKNLIAARQKLDSMLSAKRQLEVEVENLQARLTMVEVAEASSRVTVHDSQLSKTRDLIDAIGSRIDVAEKLLDAEVEPTGAIPVDQPQSEDLLDQISRYFGEPQVETVVVTP
jgi:chromosome segregation ATPase